MHRSFSKIACFRAALYRERAKADRTEHEFSVLLLETNAAQAADVDELLIDKVREQIRLSDEIGFFDARRVGVLLPDTGESGALKLANDIRRGTRPSPPKVTVYTYPGKWLPEDPPALRSFSDGVNESSGVSSGCPQTLFNDGMPVWKRIFDIVGATAALVILFPLFLLVGTVISIVSPGPIFLRQNRVGYQG